MKYTIFGEGINLHRKVAGVRGDMGEVGEMTLLQQPDGDVILSLTDGEHRLSLEFCTNNGGGRYPVIARKLRELIAELTKGELPEE